MTVNNVTIGQTDGMIDDQFIALRYVLGENNSDMVTNAIAQLRKAGFYNTESDYNGMIGRAVETLIRILAAQHHSGYSVAIVTDLFGRLVREGELE